MSPKKYCKLCLLLCISAEIAGCGNRSLSIALPAGQPPAAFIARQRQMAVDKEVDQINSSNLAPLDKQRMINQVQTSSGQL